MSCEEFESFINKNDGETPETDHDPLVLIERYDSQYSGERREVENHGMK